MKTSILYAYVALMGMASAQEACEEGRRVTISPGYTVEYRCNKFRLGQQRYENVLSHQDCATKCQVGGVEVCTYHAVQKKCIVGDPNGREGTSNGATYMVRVPEEPEDPFPETCEKERDGFKTELDKCRADLEAASKKPPTCGVNKWSQGWYHTMSASNIAACRNACNADIRCLSYSGSPAGPTFCYLYDKETADLPAMNPNVNGYAGYDKRCI